MQRLCLVTVLVMILPTLCALGDDAPGKNPASAKKPAAPAAAKKPAKPLITISKETTYITGPLRPDGYVDYLAAINQRASQGVTPENNAAVPFFKAMGPGMVDKNCRDRYYKMLGMAPLPEEGVYFVSLDKYADVRSRQAR